MLIHVTAIPPEGQTLTLNRDTGWFQSLLTQKLSDLKPQTESAEGEIQIFKTMQNISLAGEVSLSLFPICARCGQTFEAKLEIPIQRHLAPYFFAT